MVSKRELETSIPRDVQTWKNSHRWGWKRFFPSLFLTILSSFIIWREEKFHLIEMWKKRKLDKKTSHDKRHDTSRDRRSVSSGYSSRGSHHMLYFTHLIKGWWWCGLNDSDADRKKKWGKQTKNRKESQRNLMPTSVYTIAILSSLSLSLLTVYLSVLVMIWHIRRIRLGLMMAADVEEVRSHLFNTWDVDDDVLALLSNCLSRIKVVKSGNEKRAESGVTQNKRNVQNRRKGFKRKEREKENKKKSGSDSSREKIRMGQMDLSGGRGVKRIFSSQLKNTPLDTEKHHEDWFLPLKRAERIKRFQALHSSW